MKISGNHASFERIPLTLASCGASPSGQVNGIIWWDFFNPIKKTKTHFIVYQIFHVNIPECPLAKYIVVPGRD